MKNEYLMYRKMTMYKLKTSHISRENVLLLKRKAREFVVLFVSEITTMCICTNRILVCFYASCTFRWSFFREMRLVGIKPSYFTELLPLRCVYYSSSMGFSVYMIRLKRLLDVVSEATIDGVLQLFMIEFLHWFVVNEQQEV